MTVALIKYEQVPRLHKINGFQKIIQKMFGSRLRGTLQIWVRLVMLGTSSCIQVWGLEHEIDRDRQFHSANVCIKHVQVVFKQAGNLHSDHFCCSSSCTLTKQIAK